MPHLPDFAAVMEAARFERLHRQIAKPRRPAILPAPRPAARVSAPFAAPTGHPTGDACSQ